MSPTSAVSSSSSETMSARRSARSCGASRSASPSTWMLARRLAIGVRSSWLASATRFDCAEAERSSASSVRLKLRARRVSSSRPVSSSRCERSGSPVSASVAPVKRRMGFSAVRATSAPRAIARSTPTPATIASCTSSRPSSSSTSVSGRATWIAPSWPTPTVSTRRCTPSTWTSREVASGAAHGGRPRARVERERAGVARIAASHGAVGRDLLDEPGGVAVAGARRADGEVAGVCRPARWRRRGAAGDGRAGS